MKFSVLISVYHRENPAYLDKALQSILGQSLSPSEIILVKDGSLTPALDKVIINHQKAYDDLYKIIVLKRNLGLGKALNEGLKHCSYDWVARMDSDDIALPDRFEKQIAYLEKHSNVDILGSWICEFNVDPCICIKQRKVPSTHEQIVAFAKYRNPLNHMTVVFRKKAVLDAGGYMPMNGFEDYFLWMRMLMNGKKFANLPEVLVKARTGKGMISRRQGLGYAKDEWGLERAAYKLGFWSTLDLARNLFTRVLPRLLPVAIVEKLYNLLRKF